MTLPAADQAALEHAVLLLEQPRFAVRVAQIAGKPFGGALKLLPGATRSLHRVVHGAMVNCLDVAIASRDGENFAPAPLRAKALAGVTGGLSGFFGGLLLPVELPLTITLMLRAIADIASDEGEDLRLLESRLACLQVFALSEGRVDADADAAMAYYTARATLTRLSADIVATLAQRGTIEASTPVVARLVAEIVSRFGIVVSERAAAGAVPIIGALGGATLNIVFMDHFERVARGHFAIRRLERAYGSETIDRLYRLAAKPPRAAPAAIAPMRMMPS